MTLYVKAGGSLRTIQALYVKAGGALRQLHSLRVKAGGILRELLVQYFSPWAGQGVPGTVFGPNNVFASITINAVGGVQSSALLAGEWVSPAPAGVGAQHQVMYTVVSGPSAGLSVSAPAAGVWYSLSSNFTVEVSNNYASRYSGSLTVRIQVRRESDNAVVCDGNVQLSVSREL